MVLRRAGRRTPSRRPRPVTPNPNGRSWWQGWQLKAAIISAVVPLVAAALWGEGVELVNGLINPAPSSSASTAAANGPAAGPPASPSAGPPVSPAPDASASDGPSLPPEPSWEPPDPSPTPNPDPTDPKPSPPEPDDKVNDDKNDEANVSTRVRRSGTLVMADYTAYDLDSQAADWNPTKGEWGSNRDLGYASWWPDASNDAIISRDDPKNAASLPGTGPWQRADCVRAGYGQPSARPIGDRLLEGRGICVITSSGRYALLVVTRSVEKQLTVRATVWD